MKKEYDNTDYEKRMMARASKGHCFKCGAMLGRVAMLNHVQKERSEFGNDEKCTILEISSFSKSFWMVVEAGEDTNLKELDIFLREAWMECCGHLSMFVPKSNTPWREKEISKSKMISSFLEGPELAYLYDFGTTSYAQIKVISTSSREKCKGSIRILARNDPVHPRCEKCGTDATLVLWDSFDENEYSALCEDCGKKYEHPVDRGKYAPYANSPRMGLCGYTGEFDRFGYVPGGGMPESKKISGKKTVSKTQR